jgi:hypothetical protein
MALVRSQGSTYADTKEQLAGIAVSELATNDTCKAETIAR